MLLCAAFSGTGCIDDTPVDENVAATNQALFAALNPSADTSVTSLNIYNSNGSATGLYVGTDNLTTPGRHRTLIRFDLSTFANATITAATLYMYMDKMPAAPATDYQMLWRATQQWWPGTAVGTAQGLECSANGYGATWYSAWCNSGTYAWTSAGGSVAASWSAYVAPADTTTLGWKSWSSSSYAQVLTDVQGWANGSVSNYGWVVRGWYEANGTGANLSARRYSSSEGTSPPQLQLTYTCNSGYTQSGNGCTTISNYCGAPASVVNATYTVSGGVAGGSTYSLNATANYTCSGGYTQTGADSVCQASATWSAAPTCTVVSNYCGTPPTVTNSGGAVVSGGAAGGSTNSVGATAAYNCNTGYSKSGSNSTCQSNGTWSAAPTCTAVTNWCAAPAVVTNAGAAVVSGGVAGGSTNSYLATAAYTCNTGYVKAGSNPQCQSNQLWSASPTCSPVNCGSAPSVANSVVGVSGGAGGGSTTTYLATAAYTCNGGYSKSGSDAVCQSNGTWSAAPSCTVVSNYCGAPTAVANATVSVSGGAAGGSTNSVNATAAYACATGYSLSGSNSTCQTNGLWTAAPSCVVVASWCAAPPSNISNGSYSLGAGLGGYTSSLGATATYSCSAGYSVSGTNPSTCQTNQTWSTAPSCNAISSYCPAVPSVTNATAGTPTGGAAGGATLSLNATVTYACNGGYSMSGTNPITCQSNATWTTGPTCTVVSNYCGSPATIANGSVSSVSGGAAGGSTNSVGATATYACAVGYKFSAGSSATCQSNGSWSASPSCIVDTAWCAAAPVVTNAGVATLTGGLGGNGTTSYQATATYACNGGYSGGGASTCQASKSWTASPTCSAVVDYCGTAPSVANSSGVAIAGGAAGGSTNSVGATASYTCSAGYTLTGSAATCQSNGLWSSAPTCAPTSNFCGSPAVVANAAAAVVSGGAAGGSTNSLGATAAYTCNVGYVKSGSDATCLSSGSWSASPSCTAEVAWCSAAPTVTNASAPLVSGGIAGGTTTSLNAIASYTCNGGYAFAAGGSATCQSNHSWTTTPVCNVVSNYCGAPPAVTNAASVGVSGGAAGGSTNSVGATAAYTCNAGYSLSGSNATCGTSGSWSTAPTCVPIAAYCSAAPSVTNAAAPVVSGGAGGGSTTSVGATAAYTCSLGYSKSGSDATCQTNGSWSATPTCNPVDCGTPPSVANAPVPIITGGNGGGSTTTYGSVAAYTCNSGYSQTGADPTCQVNGTWSGTPSCDDVDECLSNPCGVGSCNNLVGSYSCTCPMGTHVFNNGTCEALNACNNGTATCLPIADCTSSDPVNFTCACPSPGYTGDGITNCTDVDECASAIANDCDATNAICTNTTGSYVCGCAAGYSGDGITSCAAISNYCGSTPVVANAGSPTVSGGAAGGTTNSLSAIATYACSSGYAFVAGSTSVCQSNGSWSAPPTCAPIASYCGAAPVVVNAAAAVVSGGVAGGSTSSLNAIAGITCNAGYTKSGSDSVCQSNGSWSTAPTCDPVGNFCGAPPSVTNAGAPSVSGGAAGGATYSLSATAAYTCNPGYAKSGADSVCGSSATWSAPPSCTVVASFCPAASSITHASVPVVAGGAAGGNTTSYGAVATYTCDAGYAFSAGSTANCQADMTWSTLPSCNAVPSFCGAPPVVANAAAPAVSGGAAGGSTTSLNAVASYTCAAGFTKSGADATCQSNGSWTAAPTCVEDPSWCAAPPSVANASAPSVAGGIAGGTSTSLNAVATYACATGYAFVGGATSSCQTDHSWSSAPVCGAIASFCGAPPTVANAGSPGVAGGIAGGSTSSLDAVATYACNAGYELAGGATAACLSSGSWSAAPSCVPTVSYCPSAPTVVNAGAPSVAGGIAGGTSTSLAAIATYVCDAGYDLVGAPSVCGIGGTWSAAPSCVPRDCGTPPMVANAGTPTVGGGAGGGSTTTYGASAGYVCNAGYELSGGDAVCLASGSWSAAPSCVDIDECATNNGGCGSATFVVCSNNIGAAPTCTDIDECATANGGCGDPTFMTCINNDASAPTCQDVDECATNNGGCGDATYFGCVNNVGSVASCSDIDECATNNGGCGTASLVTCSNNVGGAPTCIDIDECTTNNGGCGDPTYFTCTNNLVAAPTCADIDECATSNGSCGDPGYYFCVNVVGGSPTCGDIDECATNNGNCGNPVYFACTNVVGAAPSCTDIDECATNNGGCGDATYYACTNVVGATPTCADIDECATNNGGCGAAGVYTCANNVGAPPTCGDVDDCASAPCTAGAVCTDQVGSFFCTCPAGFSGDGVTSCDDIDECALATDDCAPSAVCSNTVGSFVCTCPLYFQGTGKQCADIDECTTDNGGCAPNEVCTNRVGLPPLCECMLGTTADGGSACAVHCGDGVRGVGEECDDANVVAGDGCSVDCRIESGYACHEPTDTVSTCTATCGNGWIDPPAEECDDAANNSATAIDACRPNCKLAHCGDGVVDTSEACDTGASNSDTAPNTCRTDCRNPFCGDGVVDSARNESCDTGGGIALADSVCSSNTCPAPDGGMGDGGMGRAEKGSCGCRVAESSNSRSPTALPWVMLMFALVWYRRTRR